MSHNTVTILKIFIGYIVGKINKYVVIKKEIVFWQRGNQSHWFQ